MNSIRTESRIEREAPHCIWMQAGVVRRKYCREAYQCVSCRFDRALGKVADENRKRGLKVRGPGRKRSNLISWKEKLKERPPWKRPCIHHMKGRIEFRACTHEYRCGDCEFDQYFDDQYNVHAVVRPVEMMEIEGFRIPQGYYLHPGHTWLKVEEGCSVRVGMDDFSLRMLGPLDRIESPLLGKAVCQGNADISVYRGANMAKVRSPVTGVVTSINAPLRENGHPAHADPFSAGWIMRVHARNLREDLANLVINTETGEFMEGEVERLHRVIEEVQGPLSTDGGQLSRDIYGSLPSLGWKRLTKLFLGT